MRQEYICRRSVASLKNVGPVAVPARYPLCGTRRPQDEAKEVAGVSAGAVEALRRRSDLNRRLTNLGHALSLAATTGFEARRVNGDVRSGGA